MAAQCRQATLLTPGPRCDVSAAAQEFAREMIRFAGTRAWEDAEVRAAIIAAANEIAQGIDCMALPDTILVQAGTEKTFKSSGGSSAITLASLANNAARQSVKLDLGATRAELYAVKADFEIAATPTAGNTIDLYWAPSSSATAGSDNPGNVSGADAAYTGYSANIDASVKQLVFIGSFICTAQATANVQKAAVGTFAPPHRYGSLVVYDKSGAALHSSDTNINITFTPLEGVIAD